MVWLKTTVSVSNPTTVGCNIFWCNHLLPNRDFAYHLVVRIIKGTANSHLLLLGLSGVILLWIGAMIFRWE